MSTAEQLETTPATRPIHVVIADDHTLVRSGLRLLLEAEEGFVVEDEAAEEIRAAAPRADADPPSATRTRRSPSSSSSPCGLPRRTART